jgi:hypothetical protein
VITISTATSTSTGRHARLVRRAARIACALLTAAGAGVTLASPRTVPRLRVCANGHFLQDGTGRPFFWLADTAWLLFSRFDRAEAERYLEDRRSKGFTVVQVMVVHEASDVNASGRPAFADGDPARPLVTPGADPADSVQYDFWDHVDYIVDRAGEKGLVVAMVPAWGEIVRQGALNAANVERYAAFLAERYRDRPHIVWVVGGDTRGDQQSDVWRAMGRTLRAADPGHLITFHPFGRTQSSTWFHDEPWLDFNMYQSGHRSYEQDPEGFGEDNWRYALGDWSRTPPKPTLDGEPSYEGIPHGLHDTTQPYWNSDDTRRYAYWSVFAGACGHTYGHNAVMQMHKPGDPSPSYGPRQFWLEALGAPGAQQMRHLKALMLSRPFVERVPDASLVADPPQPRYDRVLATRGSGYALFYTYTGRPFTARMGVISGRKTTAWWYDPRQGRARRIGRFDNRGERRFAPPGKPGPGNDWVLVLDDEARGFDPPGSPQAK